MLNLFVKSIKKRLLDFIIRNLSPNLYWNWRAFKYGKRAVVNLGHPEHELEMITHQQKAEIFPYLTQLLTGNEKRILDFGCGPGRFTIDLASLIAGTAIGVDPIGSFLTKAPKHTNVEYYQIINHRIPLSNSSVDVVWVCLVLGGIQGENLTFAVNEILRVLKQNGLLFVVENTSEKNNSEHWYFRSISDYQHMFPGISLVHIHDYYDLAERISIIAGRKNVQIGKIT
uniref:Class I SAM-dependent methyltransferase n=1 Tax=Planktothricoides sp. SpSt-374 TaxID=2282167 RepID=A0A7C3VH84_9CYAN